MKFDVLTLFPEMIEAPLKQSLIGRAQKAKLVDIRVHQLRNWSDDKRHQKVDDRPFGGGPGMVLRPEPVYRALKDLGGLKKSRSKPWVVYLSPQGKTLTQNLAKSMVKKKHVILICGHYEGIDERLMAWIDQEISIGDYVLTGGELPAMVFIDCVSRLIPGVVGDSSSLDEESFNAGRLGFPHYTRPESWRGKVVPKILMSGHHQKIQEWRDRQSQKATQKKRPDLLKK